MLSNADVPLVWSNLLSAVLPESVNFSESGPVGKLAGASLG